MKHLDIIALALIAAVLLGRLWFVFGRRNDTDQQRPNPFATPAPGLRESETATQGAATATELRSPFTPILMAPMSLAGGLERVAQLDPTFEEKQFLKDARSQFTDILTAFAKGDLSSVSSRLGPVVLAQFEAAIAARKRAGETMENHIARMRDVETTAAETIDSLARVTVQFVTEQQNLLRAQDGTIISGETGQSEEITDIWVFARDTKVKDAPWQVVETRS